MTAREDEFVPVPVEPPTIDGLRLAMTARRVFRLGNLPPLLRLIYLARAGLSTKAGPPTMREPHEATGIDRRVILTLLEHGRPRVEPIAPAPPRKPRPAPVLSEEEP